MVRGQARLPALRSQAHGWRGRALNRRSGGPADAGGNGARPRLGAMGALIASALAALVGVGLALRLLAERRA